MTVIAIGEQGKLDLDSVSIGRGAIVSVGKNAEISIGKGSYLADGSKILATNKIRIGSACAISWSVTFLDDDGHGFGPPPYSSPIVVGDNVWIGCNVTILKGVNIGSGSVVAAGSVVTRSCEPGSLLAGVPARVIRREISWTDQSRLSSNSTLNSEI
ncbi:acyltransferase [Telmatocola sphagniphila]|uniref:Acyltransferase n=1 Tax=Telmatocola sphagniphila TaxID=1123043 RepID=A0A8E6B8E5_9BACT|nr:acyltransferase [Telmatocola sphagniphila]